MRLKTAEKELTDLREQWETALDEQAAAAAAETESSDGGETLVPDIDLLKIAPEVKRERKKNKRIVCIIFIFEAYCRISHGQGDTYKRHYTALQTNVLCM